MIYLGYISFNLQKGFMHPYREQKPAFTHMNSLTTVCKMTASQRSSQCQQLTHNNHSNTADKSSCNHHIQAPQTFSTPWTALVNTAGIHSVCILWRKTGIMCSGALYFPHYYLTSTRCAGLKYRAAEYYGQILRTKRNIHVSMLRPSLLVNEIQTDDPLLKY